MIGTEGTSNYIRTGLGVSAWQNVPILDLPDKVAVVAATHQQAVLALASHCGHPNELLIAPAAMFDFDLQHELLAAGFSVVHGLGTSKQTLTATDSPVRAERGAIWLLTSGSTGRPKRVKHTLSSLKTVAHRQPPRTWLCAYAPGSYAWWQVLTLALSHADNNVVCVESDEIDEWPRIALEQGVTAVSGTPTFWRHAIWRDRPGVAALPLDQVTLGGEPVDQAILDALHRLHTQARISWIYASSEAGAAIAVHDGKEGFPVAWLNRKKEGRPRISVLEGELILDSPFAAEGSGSGLRTGDRVEIREGRVRIIGRIRSDEINVGGSKASAGQVRERLLAHPNVAWASVRGRRAPIVGQVVVADVVLLEPTDTTTLTRWCADTLPDFAVPRRIEIVHDVPLKESMKSDV